MNRPVSAVGLLIMIMAVVVGFVPNIFSILLLFVTTLFGGYQIKKHAPESYDGFITKFGHAVVIFNIIFVGMVMLIPSETMSYIDKASAAFLNIMVIVVMMTFLHIKGKQKK